MTPNANEIPESLPPTSQDQLASGQRPAPIQVYRSKVYRSEDVNGWIVEAPRDVASTVGKMVFTGTQASQLALTYAYERFGNARFFPYSGEDH